VQHGNVNLIFLLGALGPNFQVTSSDNEVQHGELLVHKLRVIQREADFWGFLEVAWILPKNQLFF
jgi:hypothetical protein